MKKIFLFIATALMAAGCGVGSYSHSSGKADACELSFTSPKKMDITVQVDGKSYDLQSIRTSDYKTRRNIRKTAANTINLEPGTHEVKVLSKDTEIYAKKLYISTSEHKVIDL